MKQIIIVYIHFILLVATMFIIAGSCLLPIIYIDNILFVILYIVILWPWIMVVIYKIVIALDNKINKILAKSIFLQTKQLNLGITYYIVLKQQSHLVT